jgi:hypothetical protein
LTALKGGCYEHDDTMDKILLLLVFEDYLWVKWCAVAPPVHRFTKKMVIGNLLIQ